METIQEKLPVIKTLRSLDLFDSVSFPLNRTWVVRNSITIVCLNEDLKFKTETNRDEKVITVTRTK